jgi:hypothetical protein
VFATTKVPRRGYKNHANDSQQETENLAAKDSFNSQHESDHNRFSYWRRSGKHTGKTGVERLFRPYKQEKWDKDERNRENKKLAQSTKFG